MAINGEIRQIFKPLLSSREFNILSRRFCGETLKSIGDSIGVTKERVRQIHNIINDKIIDESDHILYEMNKFIYKDARLTSPDDLFVHGIILELSEIDTYKFIAGHTVSIDDYDYILESLKDIKHTISHSGISKSKPINGVSIDIFINMIKKYIDDLCIKGSSVSIFCMKSLIFSWIPSQKRPISSRILKMLSICDSGYGIHIDIVYDKLISSTMGKHQFNLSLQEFREMLIDGNSIQNRKSWPVLLKKNIVTTDSVIDKQKILSKGEFAVFCAIVENKGECSAAYLSRVFKEKGLARITTFVTLSKTPIVDKVMRDTYNLVKVSKLNA